MGLVSGYIRVSLIRDWYTMESESQLVQGLEYLGW